MNSHDVRREWAERSGEYSPGYYAYYGADETSESVGSILDRHLDSDASVLELGCSSGRHLAHLQDRGYENLAGIEINDDAFDVMAETYPDLADSGTFYNDSIESVVESLPDDHFDAVFSVETLQHLHPDAEWVYEEIARIAGELLVTIENEGDDASEETESGVNYVQDEFPLYYRDWGRIFTELGFETVPIEPDERTVVHERDTVRAFRSIAD